MKGRIVQFVTIVATIGAIILVPDGIIGAEVKIQLVLFALSVGMALVGIHLGLDARRIIIERRSAVNKYERPHVVHALEILFNDMEQTKAVAQEASEGDGVEGVHSVIRSRIGRHLDVESEIASRFLEIGMADLHTHLDPAFMPLGEIGVLGDFDVRGVVDKLGDAMEAVVVVIDSIKEAPPLR